MARVGPVTSGACKGACWCRRPGRCAHDGAVEPQAQQSGAAPADTCPFALRCAAAGLVDPTITVRRTRRRASRSRRDRLRSERRRPPVRHRSGVRRLRRGRARGRRGRGCTDRLVAVGVPTPAARAAGERAANARRDGDAGSAERRARRGVPRRVRRRAGPRGAPAGRHLRARHACRPGPCPHPGRTGRTLHQYFEALNKPHSRSGCADDNNCRQVPARTAGPTRELAYLLDLRHVGCCDSSPGRRAAAHHAHAGHPLVPCRCKQGKGLVLVPSRPGRTVRVTQRARPRHRRAPSDARRAPLSNTTLRARCPTPIRTNRQRCSPTPR